MKKFITSFLLIAGVFLGCGDKDEQLPPEPVVEENEPPKEKK